MSGRGDAPVEDWTPESDEQPRPFDKDELNRRLAMLATEVTP